MQCGACICFYRMLGPRLPHLISSSTMANITQFNGSNNNHQLKKAYQIGNEYSDIYCHKSYSKHLIQKRLDLIRLVDQEITDTSNQLLLLRTQLEELKKSKINQDVNNKRMTPSESSTCSVAVQTEQQQKQQQLNVNNGAIQTSNRIPSENIENCSNNRSFECFHSDVELSTDPKATDVVVVASHSEPAAKAVHLDEERYLAKLRMIMQNRKGGKSKNPTQQDNDLTNNDHHDETRQQKESISQLTNEPSINHDIFPNYELIDQTIYLELPTNDKVSKKIRNLPTTANSFPNSDEPSKTNHIFPLQMDLVKKTVDETFGESLFWDETDCNSQQYKTLPGHFEVTSDSITPKNLLISTSTNSVSSALDKSLAELNINSTSNDMGSSRFSLLSQLNAPLLDRDQFWTDVFAMAN